MILSLVTSIAVFAAIILAGYWVARRSPGIADMRVHALAMGGGSASRAEGSFAERMILPTIHSLTRALLSVLPATLIARTEQRLAVAGKPMTVSAFFSLVLALAILPLVAMLIVVVIYSKGPPSGVAFLVVAVLTVLFSLSPFLWLRTRIRRRQMKVWKGLPDALDLVTVCVEAGLGLDAAFRRVSEELEGPFAEEIAQMLQEVDMGKPRREALADLAARTGVTEVGVFINAVVQSQQMGTSLAQTLRSQAQSLRMQRRQRAEQSARQAPVKMAFPLVLCLMPSLFIVIIGPIGVTLVRTLSER